MKFNENSSALDQVIPPSAVNAMASTLPSENLILKFTAIHKDDFLSELEDSESRVQIFLDVQRSRRYAREFKLKSNATNYNIQLKSITQNPLDYSSGDPLAAVGGGYIDIDVDYTNLDSNDFVVSEMNTNNDGDDEQMALIQLAER